MQQNFYPKKYSGKQKRQKILFFCLFFVSASASVYVSSLITHTKVSAVKILKLVNGVHLVKCSLVGNLPRMERSSAHCWIAIVVGIKIRVLFSFTSGRNAQNEATIINRRKILHATKLKTNTHNDFKCTN